MQRCILVRNHLNVTFVRLDFLIGKCNYFCEFIIIANIEKLLDLHLNVIGTYMKNMAEQNQVSLHRNQQKKKQQILKTIPVLV